jgi:hypothetical protein
VLGRRCRVKFDDIDAAGILYDIYDNYRPHRRWRVHR